MTHAKTLEIHLAEERERIAQQIESKREALLEDAKALGADAYLVASRTLMVCAGIARNG